LQRLNSDFPAAKSKAGSAWTSQQALPGTVGRSSGPVFILLYQLQLWERCQHILNDLQVLGRLNTAGAVNDSSTGSEPLDGFEEKSGLQHDQFLLTLLSESPASFRATCQDARIGAGGVDDRSIERPGWEVAAIA
jgi:hypothetical protein